MIEVGDGQHHPELGAEFEQNPQQCHRIGSPGHGYGNTIAGL